MFVQEMARDCHFSLSSWAIPVEILLEELRINECQGGRLIESIQTESCCPEILPVCNFTNVLESLYDRMYGLLRAEEPRLIDSSGWEIMISLYTKGKRSAQLGLESILFANFFNWARENSRNVAGEILKRLHKSLNNHHKKNSPWAAFALTWNACWSLNKHGFLSTSEIWMGMWPRFNLETAVQDVKLTQPFELESLPMGADHSQMVKAAHVLSDSSSKGCVNLTSSTAVSRFNEKAPVLMRAIHDLLGEEGKADFKEVEALLQLEFLFPGSFLGISKSA